MGPLPTAAKSLGLSCRVNKGSLPPVPELITPTFIYSPNLLNLLGQRNLDLRRGLGLCNVDYLLSSNMC